MTMQPTEIRMAHPRYQEMSNMAGKRKVNEQSIISEIGQLFHRANCGSKNGLVRSCIEHFIISVFILVIVIPDTLTLLCFALSLHNLRTYQHQADGNRDTNFTSRKVGQGLDKRPTLHIQNIKCEPMQYCKW